MPAGPIGTSWAAGSWAATAWQAGTWADIFAGFRAAWASGCDVVLGRDRA